MTKPQHANEGEKNSAWNAISNVLALPGKLQGYVINAILNTIDRAQTASILRESAELLKNQSNGKQDNEKS